ncbi:MAG: hypothetical protein F7B60_07425 [Desulfurococcales archaeon]|nr:hypothetical protein [Desulfurococcales archaeon]
MEKGLDLIRIEGLTMSGLVKEVGMLNCDNGRAKLVVSTVGGERIETACIEKDAARRNYAVIKLYLKWSKHINRDLN